MTGANRMARIVAAMLLFSLPLSGCAGASPTPDGAQPDSHRFTDALGREIAVESPQRVVALMGSFAEVWLLAGGELAGVTSDAVTERGLDLAESVADVGRFNEPSLEAILAIDPDLVLLSSETPAHVALLEALDGAGIPAACFRVDHFSSYLEMLETCTAITGRPDLYEENGAAVQQKIEAVLAEERDSEAPSVLLMITWSGGVAVQGSDTMAGRMLRELGCENLTDRLPGLLREFSLETVIAEDPDWILIIPMGNDDALAERNLAEAVEGHPAWQGLNAVQNGRYRQLPKELFLYKPNAAWAESYIYLREVLYGA